MEKMKNVYAGISNFLIMKTLNIYYQLQFIIYCNFIKQYFLTLSRFSIGSIFNVKVVGKLERNQSDCPLSREFQESVSVRSMTSGQQREVVGQVAIKHRDIFPFTFSH